jgi:hypothetical protein
MRPISVSTQVFARIWALRRPGEQSEDAVLRRVLGCHDEEPEVKYGAAEAPGLEPSSPKDGVFDRRHNIHFAEGFEVFRVYLGRDFRARANNGSWIRSDGTRYRSLNELSRSIGARTENAWLNWFFASPTGSRLPVATLREGSESSHGEFKEETETNPNEEDMTWRSDVRKALEQLGGRASLRHIYRETSKIRRAAGRSLPQSFDATVRRTLEEHSSDSLVFRGIHDLFWMPEGKGAGVWALRDNTQ